MFAVIGDNQRVGTIVRFARMEQFQSGYLRVQFTLEEMYISTIIRRKKKKERKKGLKENE